MLSALEVSAGQWLSAIALPFVNGYIFPAVFFGFHYSGKIWTHLDSFLVRFTGMAGMNAALYLLVWFRFTGAFLLGPFGGGIIQFQRYRKTISQQES